MGNFNSSQVHLIIGGYDLVGDGNTKLKDLTFPGMVRVLEETTGLGAGAENWNPTGDFKAKQLLSHSGYLDDAALASKAALCSLPLAARSWCGGVEGKAIGRGAWFGSVLQLDFQDAPKKGELTKVLGTHQPTGIIYPNGLILKDHASPVTVTGNSQASSIDNGASSAGGGAAVAFITNLVLGTATNLVLKVRHSTDNSTWADLITFSTATTAPFDGGVLTVAGTVNRYLACSWTFGGSPDGATTATIEIVFMRG
jgi:hypothetical protein